MPRYFIELSYKGTNYSGFQVQENANSIQAEVEKCLFIFYKVNIILTGSSRTDSGVHAKQNIFHFDFEEVKNFDNDRYNLNAILPADIVIQKIFEVPANLHCRFDALSREYNYFIYCYKDPFLADKAYYFPYKIDKDKLDRAAELVSSTKDFTSFSKRNTQVNNFKCSIYKSQWKVGSEGMNYEVTGNRFLRGMVRGLVGTMLKVGTGKMSIEEFRKIIDLKDCTKADFSVPAHGLFLMEVKYADGIMK